MRFRKLILSADNPTRLLSFVIILSQVLTFFFLSEATDEGKNYVTISRAFLFSSSWCSHTVFSFFSVVAWVERVSFFLLAFTHQHNSTPMEKLYGKLIYFIFFWWILFCVLLYFFFASRKSISDTIMSYFHCFVVLCYRSTVRDSPSALARFFSVHTAIPFYSVIGKDKKEKNSDIDFG